MQDACHLLMSDIENNSRDTFIMRMTAAVTTLLLLVTVLVSWYFNLFHTGVWFLRAALFLVMALALIWRLAVHINKPWLRGLAAVVLVELLAFYAAGRLVSFYY